MRSGPKSVSPKKTPLSFCCAGPTPVKSGFVVAGPSFEDGFNLLGAVDLSARVVKNAQDNQEELVMGDTPPGPGPAGFLTDSHETLSTDGILAVLAASGPWRCSDQHGKLSADGLFVTPGFAGLRGRRASRAARRVQISESSFNRSGKCVDSAQSCSFSDNFEPHRRVISCDNDLFALDLLSKSTLVSDSRVLLYLVLLVAYVRRLCQVCLHVVSVVVVRWTDRMCHGAGSVRRMHVVSWLIRGVITLIAIRGNTGLEFPEEQRH